MKNIVVLALILVSSLLMAQFIRAGEIVPYPIQPQEIEDCKQPLDDPRPFLTECENYKKLLPSEVYDQLTYDRKAMKRVWEEVVGFKAPDLVGKIAPEIKPGKYTLGDKTKYPFEALMPRYFYNKWNPPGEGGPNHIANFTEFTIVPTRQHYYALPLGEATKKHMGTVRLDDQGYILEETYNAGIPFPRPSGPHKAWQIVWNFVYRYIGWEEWSCNAGIYGVNAKFNRDYEGSGTYYRMRLQGRTQFEPVGRFYDDRARNMQERTQAFYEAHAPRDNYGNFYYIVEYLPPEKLPSFLIYYNAIRRIRKYSSSDTQDQAIGADYAMDDNEGLMQSLNPKVYPYEPKVIDETEVLLPISLDGKPWISTKEKWLFKDLEFERRPVFVVELKQQDPNYIYSKRIWWVDRETFLVYVFENYDQKGRLYRTQAPTFILVPGMGTYFNSIFISLDHIDVHSTIDNCFQYPAPGMRRNELSVKRLMRAIK